MSCCHLYLSESRHKADVNPTDGDWGEGQWRVWSLVTTRGAQIGVYAVKGVPRARRHDFQDGYRWLRRRCKFATVVLGPRLYLSIQNTICSARLTAYGNCARGASGNQNRTVQPKRQKKCPFFWRLTKMKKILSFFGFFSYITREFENSRTPYSYLATLDKLWERFRIWVPN